MSGATSHRKPFLMPIPAGLTALPQYLPDTLCLSQGLFPILPSWVAVGSCLCAATPQGGCFHSCFTDEGNCGSERLINLPKVTQLRSGSTIWVHLDPESLCFPLRCPCIFYNISTVPGACQALGKIHKLEQSLAPTHGPGGEGECSFRSLAEIGRAHV